MNWRIIDTGHLDAAHNMAMDDVLLDSRAGDGSPNTLRFLQFRPSAVLVGYHQSVEAEVRVDYCRENGIDINRRITGGGAILFDSSSLGWEMIASKRDFGIEGDFFGQEKVFRRFCDGAIRGFKALGIEAEFRPKNDIEVNGRKISGTGGTQREDAFLFQGTLLVDMDVETMLRALRIPMEKLKDKEIDSVKDRVTSVRLELGRVPEMSTIKRAMVEGFQNSLGVSFKPSGLTETEEDLLQKKLNEFRSYSWIYSERLPLRSNQEVQAIAKTPGGLIRASLILDPADTIRTILITGDFFVYPQRAIFDLEAALKGVDCKRGAITAVVEDVFKGKDIRIPGVESEELVDIIIKAARKTRYASMGLSLSEANHIFEVNIDPEKPPRWNYSALLIPYCAKLPACSFRASDGCVQCGGCTVGDAYRLADERGLKPITIVNFEDLMDRLHGLREQGSSGFIGCCCEGFFCKHQDDFEKAGLPGLLIDIDDATCYELGKEHEALIGDFENQTSIKTELLAKIVEKLACGKRHA